MFIYTVLTNIVKLHFFKRFLFCFTAQEKRTSSPSIHLEVIWQQFVIFGNFFVFSKMENMWP